MIAITTNSSISVNARAPFRRGDKHRSVMRPLMFETYFLKLINS
jgi:hypothetical protein